MKTLITAAMLTLTATAGFAKDKWTCTYDGYFNDTHKLTGFIEIYNYTLNGKPDLFIEADLDKQPGLNLTHDEDISLYLINGNVELTNRNDAHTIVNVDGDNLTAFYKDAKKAIKITIKYGNLNITYKDSRDVLKAYGECF